MRRTAFALAALLLSLAIPAAAQQTAPAPLQPKTVLTGVVLDANNLQPLRAARVRVPSAEVDVLTDAEGRFVGPEVETGTYGAVVSLLGYRQNAQIFTIAPGEPEPQVLLEPNPVLLQALTVTAKRLERRARASGAALMGFDHDFLLASNEHDATRLVVQMAHVQAVPCGAFSTGGAPDCVVVRGVAQRACVLIDDTPASFGELSMYRPRELYRVEVYKGGEAILAYTARFAEQIAQRGWAPAPIETQVTLYCRH
jgi:hypothetical protein